MLLVAESGELVRVVVLATARTLGLISGLELARTSMQQTTEAAAPIPSFVGVLALLAVELPISTEVPALDLPIRFSSFRFLVSSLLTQMGVVQSLVQTAFMLSRLFCGCRRSSFWGCRCRPSRRFRCSSSWRWRSRSTRECRR